MQHVHVEYAGGTGWSGSGSCLYSEDAINEAAIRITGAPTHQFVTDTTIVASAGHGIDRGWRDDVVVDSAAG